MAFRTTSAALLAAWFLNVAAAAAQQNCDPACVLTQCPCYHSQVDNVNYARPPGCVAQVSRPQIL